jgi:hypothetical protein
MGDGSHRIGAALGAAGAVVLFLSMFLDWYKLDLSPAPPKVPTYNAFEGLHRSDVALAVAACVALMLAVVLLAHLFADPRPPAGALLAVGLFATAVVLYRGFKAPPQLVLGRNIDTTLEAGWYIGLVTSVVIWVGGALALLARPAHPRPAAE